MLSHPVRFNIQPQAPLHELATLHQGVLKNFKEEGAFVGIKDITRGAVIAVLHHEDGSQSTLTREDLLSPELIDPNLVMPSLVKKQQLLLMLEQTIKKTALPSEHLDTLKSLIYKVGQTFAPAISSTMMQFFKFSTQLHGDQTPAETVIGEFQKTSASLLEWHFLANGQVELHTRVCYYNSILIAPDGERMVAWLTKEGNIVLSDDGATLPVKDSGQPYGWDELQPLVAAELKLAIHFDPEPFQIKPISTTVDAYHQGVVFNNSGLADESLLSQKERLQRLQDRVYVPVLECEFEKGHPFSVNKALQAKRPFPTYLSQEAFVKNHGTLSSMDALYRYEEDKRLLASRPTGIIAWLQYFVKIFNAALFSLFSFTSKKEPIKPLANVLQDHSRLYPGTFGKSTTVNSQATVTAQSNAPPITPLRDGTDKEKEHKQEAPAPSVSPTLETDLEKLPKPPGPLSGA